MAAMRSLGRQFEWLWVAFAVSTFGTWLAFDAFALIAILVLHSGPTAGSALAAAGRVVGAAVAVPLGPWVEFRQKRPVMVAMDLLRFAAVMSVPAAFTFGWLSFAQLLIVSIIVAAADIAFRAASGAYLKALVRPEDLLVANGRFESTTWTATALGPPLGGAAISMFGPVTTVVLDAVSYLCSALGIGAIRGREPPPALADTPRLRVGDLFEGWRYILSHRTLRPLFFNTTLVNGLIMATSPLIAVLMLGHLGFKPWQYGLAFGVTCVGVFNPVLATYRLEQTETDRITRTLSAWSVTSNVTIATLTALWGLLAIIIGLRTAIAIAGVILLATPLLLPRRDHAQQHDRHLTPSRI